MRVESPVRGHGWYAEVVGRALPITIGLLLVAAAALARTASTVGSAALATYRPLTPGESSSLEITFTPLRPRAIARASIGPAAAAQAAAQHTRFVPAELASASVQVRLGDGLSVEDARIGVPPTEVYLVRYFGPHFSLEVPTPNGVAVLHELWVCVDAVTGRVLWSETYR